MIRGRAPRGRAERVNIFESESSGRNVYDILRNLGSLQVTAVEDPNYRIEDHDFYRVGDPGNKVEINVDAVWFNPEEDGAGITEKDIHDALIRAWNDMIPIVIGSAEGIDNPDDRETVNDAIADARNPANFVVSAGNGGMECPNLKHTTNLGALELGNGELANRDAIRANQSENEAIHIETYPSGPVIAG